MNTRLLNKRICCFAISGLCFYLCILICSNAEGNMQSVNEVGKMLLRQRGYPTDTVEQIIEATESESYFVRYVALGLLTERTGKEATPVLKQFLSDSHLTVRCTAAHLLGTLGDKSGFEQMCNDFQELSAKAAAPLPTDPNIAPDTIERLENQRKNNLYNALEVAKVLAELGDHRGYELAARMAFEGPLTCHRTCAARVLVEIGKTDKAILEAEGIDPVLILCLMAESEKDPVVFKILIWSVYKLDDDTRLPILEKARNSLNQPESVRKEAQLAIEGIEARKKAAEDKPKDSGGCCD